MGLDDENEGFGPGECLEHEWGEPEFERVMVETGYGPFPTFGSTYTCVWCGAIWYQPPRLLEYVIKRDLKSRGD